MPERLLPHIFAASLCIALLGVFAESVVVFGVEVVNPAIWKWGALGAVLLFPFAFRKKVSLEVFLFAYALLLWSDFIYRDYTYFLEPVYRGYVLLFGGVAWCFWRLRSRISPALLLLLVQVTIAVLFLKFSAGRALFSDDHPSFLYRLEMLREHLPFIPFYNTDWNAGYSAREFFPSGILNLFVLSSPLLALLPPLSEVEHIHYYNYVISFAFILLLPWFTYLAARVMNLTPSASAVAALLALGPSMGYFEFLLKYGTLGFSTSATLVPLTLVLAMRLGLEREEPSWWLVPGLLIVASLCLTWTLSFVAFLPAVAYGLYLLFGSFRRERWVKLGCFTLAFLILNGPWILVFIEESRVGSFLVGSSLPGKSSHSSWPGLGEIVQTLKEFRPSLSKVNPLLFFGFLPGLFCLPRGRSRNILGASVIWLALVASLGDLFKPQLELKRMIIPASFLMCLPAAAWLSALFERYQEEKSWKTGIWILASGSIMLTPLTVGASYLNRSDERFIFAPKELFTLTEALQEHTGPGRVAFLGFILQELGADTYASQNGGHIAPLAMFSGKELYASHYYHRYWTSVDPIPEAYRKKGEEGIEEFLDLINAQSVITHSRAWLKYCRERPQYEQVFQTGRFRLWRRNRESLSAFLKGAGVVGRISGGLEVQPQSEELVLKYRFLPKLRTSPEVEIFPVFAFDEDVGRDLSRRVEYIGLKVPPELIGQTIEITY